MRRTIPALVALVAAACQTGPGDRKRLNEIAGVYKKGDVKAAVAQLEPYVREHPKDDLAWTILGNAYEDEDRDGQAQQAYDTALNLNPKRAEAYVGQGVLYRKQKRYPDAEAAYRKALEIDPRNAHAYSSLTTIALKSRALGKALEYAKKGHELDAEDPVIAANLAVAYHYNNDAAERDRMTGVAERLGYRDVPRLKQIYAGEITIFDE